MLRFLLTRIATMLVTMFVISILVFFIAEVVPIDVARNALGGEFADDTAVANLREELGLDRPVLIRYVEWISGCLRGDFGLSLRSRRPVNDLIAVRLKRSLILAVLGFIFMMPLGLALGCLAGIAEGKLLDRIISLSSSLMVSSASFTRGVFLIVILSFWLEWLPGSSMPDPGVSPLEAPKTLVLPILTLAIGEIGYLARLTRVSVAEVMHSNYIRTAVLKGIPKMKVIWRHALRNAIIAPFTAIMLHVNWLIGGVVLVEVLFNYPGLGRLILDAARQNDVTVLEGGTLIMTFVAVASQVLADIGVFFLNPRIRFE